MPFDFCIARLVSVLTEQPRLQWDYEMKFNERELQWQNKQLEGFYANESSLTNQNEPHASFNPSQADGFAGHVG